MQLKESVVVKRMLSLLCQHRKDLKTPLKMRQSNQQMDSLIRIDSEKERKKLPNE